MPCKVGITTDPEKRKAYWETQVVGLTDWEILKKFTRKEDAQQFETQYAKLHGCFAQQGGAETGGPWYVYRFNYIRSK